METGVSNWKDVVEIIVWLVGAGSLALAAYSYYLSRKQLSFAVIVSCTERFQKIMPNLKSPDDKIRKNAIKQYVDLCHEELFYFKHGYLHDEIIQEWIDGMIFYLPHFKDGENVNRDECCLKELADGDFLHDYQRIRQSFAVTREYDLLNSNDRRELVEIVKSSLRN